eukprot:832533-Rhodomonas_salina.1
MRAERPWLLCCCAAEGEVRGREARGGARAMEERNDVRKRRRCYRCGGARGRIEDEIELRKCEKKRTEEVEASQSTRKTRRGRCEEEEEVSSDCSERSVRFERGRGESER